MKNSEVLAISAFVVSWIPMFPDPYYHVERVNFWEWLYREITEVFTGERVRFHSQLGFMGFIKGRLDEAYEFASYASILRKYLRLKKPLKILEWGPGFSTRIMIEEAPQAEIHTIEHDIYWADFVQDLQKNSKIHLYCIPLGDDYVNFPLSLGMRFDLIFVDGHADFREICLASSLTLLESDGIVIIHDSDGGWYGNARIYFDTVEEANRTAVLTLKNKFMESE